MPEKEKRSLTHVDETGAVSMVDVSDKDATDRTAAASAVVTMRADVLQMLLAGTLKKGEAITTAKIAGIGAAKQTGSLIPLCHPLSLEWVKVDIEPTGDTTLRILVTARTVGRTGVEMEALTGASVAALTVYDMAKAADRTMTIGPIQLESKSGGRSGAYVRA